MALIFYCLKCKNSDIKIISELKLKNIKLKQVIVDLSDYKTYLTSSIAVSDL